MPIWQLFHNRIVSVPLDDVSQNENIIWNVFTYMSMRNLKAILITYLDRWLLNYNLCHFLSLTEHWICQQCTKLSLVKCFILYFVELISFYVFKNWFVIERYKIKFKRRCYFSRKSESELFRSAMVLYTPYSGATCQRRLNKVCLCC